MQLGMKNPHTYNALYVMISNLNVEWNLQRDFFNTIGGKRNVGFWTVRLLKLSFHAIDVRHTNGFLLKVN